MSLVFALGIVAACSSQSPGSQPGDARPARTDANPDCITSPTLAIGTCRVKDTGAPCTGVPGELVEFVPITTGAAISMVIGPQGSTMFVLAIRTSGIDPGDPANVVSPDNPEIDITLLHAAGTEMALYRARSGFTAADAPMLEANGLFVVVDGQASALAGTRVTAHASVTDKHGAARCGTLQFTASP